MALLALDLGAKRTGVAISTSGQLVTPLGVWPTAPWLSFVSKLHQTIQDNGITQVVVGQVFVKDSAGQPLIDKLQADCPVPVTIVSELDTTAEARAQTGRRDHADALAACGILDRYLETQPHENPPK